LLAMGAFTSLPKAYVFSVEVGLAQF